MKPETPTHAAQRQAILDLLAAHGLVTHRDTKGIMALVRPGIGLKTRALREADLAVGATRVGGEPDLPADLAWPTGEEGPLLFVLQVALSEVTALDLEERLPSDGVLAVFADRWGRDVRVLVHPAEVPLARRPWAPTLRPPFVALGVEVQAELHLPPPASAFIGREDAALILDSDAHDAYWDGVWCAWRERLRPGPAGACGVHQLLGYAAAERHEEQAADEEVLVGFDSDDRADMQWGDVHCVWALIRREDLLHRRWSALRAEM